MKGSPKRRKKIQQKNMKCFSLTEAFVHLDKSQLSIKKGFQEAETSKLFLFILFLSKNIIL